MRRAAWIALVVGLVTMMVPTMAAATPVKSRVSLTAFGFIYPDGSYEYDFGAAVRTPKGGSKTCRQGREVSVFRDEPAGPDTLIGSRRTDAIFMVAVVVWRNPDPNTIAGDYYAMVKKQVKRKGPGTTKCLAARSRTISLNRPGFVT